GFCGGEAPSEVVFGDVVAFGEAALRGSMPRRRDHRRSLGPLGVAGEFLVTPGDGPALQEQFGAVGEGVLGGIGVEVLVDVVAAVVAAAGRIGLDRPGGLSPAALVGVVG